jgi:dTDP-4-amino-4,6-dideoxygalactose transaminase
MIPRKRLDIEWGDLLFALGRCLTPGHGEAARRRVERIWSPDGAALACLSVRSGFEALLRTLDLPPGSEVLLSAITIRDMARIVAEHGLVPVPVDLDPRTLAPCPEALARAITSRTRAVVVAHLFGSRISLEPVLQAARENGLLVIEDCAQAYTGDGWRGHPESDVTLFSFGSIKTATALGGALLRFRDRSLRDRIEALQSTWPTQSRRSFLTRIIKYAFLKLLSNRHLYTLFVLGCRLTGASHDSIISGSARGFAGGDFFHKIRHQPSTPLLALLERRFRNYDRARVTERTSLAQQTIERLPTIDRPGDQAPVQTHWVFPICHDTPDELMRFLWTRGFDATRGASSLYTVDPPPDRLEMEPAAVRRMMARLLYLPIDMGLKDSDVTRLTRNIEEFGNLFEEGHHGRHPETI